MKKLLSIITLSTFMSVTLCFAQGEKLVLSEIITIEGASKNELFKRAKMWFVDSFVDANNVIQFEDKSDGLIVGKGVFKYKASFYVGSDAVYGVIRFTTKIFVDENRYKFVFTDFIHEGNTIDFGLITNDSICPHEIDANKKWKERAWKDIQTTTEKILPPIVVGLNKAMLKPIENW